MVTIISDLQSDVHPRTGDLSDDVEVVRRHLLKDSFITSSASDPVSLREMVKSMLFGPEDPSRQTTS